MPNTIVWNTTIQTSSFTAAIDSGNFCNTTGGAFIVTLPASPARGDFVVIVDYAGTSATNNISVSGNGANINGVGSNAVLATNRQGITFTYIDSTQGWLASSNVYGGATPFTRSISVSYLVVAGGGSGGGIIKADYASGGGGAGGYLTGTANVNPGAVYTATVGGGGSAPAAGRNQGVNGSNSSLSGSGLSTITAIGGGGGAAGSAAGSLVSGSSGGSGGGSSAAGPGGAGTSGQGNAGGAGTLNSAYGGGGGGGAGAVGGTPFDPNYYGGVGGIGLQSSITGTATYYAGGGGSGDYNAGSAGGLGGGGAGKYAANGIAGTANTGGGGGGTDDSGGGANRAGGAGGSGVVILSIPTASYTGTYTGAPTITTSGANTILKFTGSGTYTA
jgi:hypothetical protein